ncbi:dicarboxylate--CoA ligase PimA [Siccirubricoccus deserti]|uniref:Long-chain fatty acid--CoA ligase n=1 Tax=Siccirubricoccus deserti TaxID=2013562 RepID=A0A9X0R1R3_9PROT|nr:long-chain fatty acid--CoA ligase [Siccirubricoccus deserti]MBC4017945.1 long-chain fatty acid--CoA ligase [Siccirubricoccus deserti]GGC61989.1 dicarboxylate--CoA ligase PimA [Siccirubricoccus deserti]
MQIIAPTYPWLRSYPPGIAWDMVPEPGTLPAMFEDAVARFADRPCLDFLGRRWRYAELGEAVARVAEGFRRLGIGPGSHVGLCLPNSPYYPMAFYGALRAGATVVNFNPLHVAEELAAQARDAEVTLMVAPDLDPILPRVLGLLGKGPVGRVVVCRFAAALPMLKGLGFRLLRRRAIARVPADDPRVLHWEGLATAPPIAAPLAVRPGDVAVLQYTGGTTGTPKAAMLTHANLTANLAQVQAWSPGNIPGQERVLAVLPFFHVFALTSVLNAGIGWGAELVLLPRFEPAQLLATIRRTRPTLFFGVPTLFKAVLDHCAKPGGAKPGELASVKLCISGGAPLPLEVKRAFEAASGCVLVEGYGLTEASPVCLCNPVESENRPGSIGLPLPAVRVEIRALDGSGTVLLPGEPGELCVAGPNVMAGYWRRPEETAAVLGEDGFLRTGDVGVMDADGYVTLIDRIKDLILCSGYNVYPRTIEEVLYRHPDVVAATVVGAPDPYRGEHPVAFVELRPGSTTDADALREFLRDKLSAIERPRRIEIRASLPRTAVGKLSKKELKAELLALRKDKR